MATTITAEQMRATMGWDRRRRLSDAEVQKIRAARLRGATFQALAKQFGCERKTISRAVYGIAKYAKV